MLFRSVCKDEIDRVERNAFEQKRHGTGTQERSDKHYDHKPRKWSKSILGQVLCMKETHILGEKLMKAVQNRIRKRPLLHWNVREGAYGKDRQRQQNHENNPENAFPFSAHLVHAGNDSTLEST